ncbi:hypothetical protein PHYBLDRAFT_70030 [Phycomyces blakesleeanus NRRL 1555(-)]|uniref:Retrotransposon gag domain-containing protein n=2 Tax=Phycomyces blakesleeanus TaxID=4837 RepID=A0A167M354_PHYB8|nr:hypothetical protein PHYBLDRAFT_70030 [Phycomyces blakesleeanus NRRL 1555(-)]OAD71634.1 hypothetical protein PHYBLDRAFT_70030 [Phycomyces blakesleeanus NRRL 1555(-)]|eukprot:XP_018289674.1 hypothetical protein PHYBLDRAFT_70030 [Phycomyces blakesleeanus NRRL 1555(-)]
MPNTPPLISNISMPEITSVNRSSKDTTITSPQYIKQTIENLRARLENLVEVLNDTVDQNQNLNQSEDQDQDHKNNYQKTIHISISEAQHDLEILESIQAKLNHTYMLQSHSKEELGCPIPTNTPYIQPDVTSLVHGENDVFFSIDEFLDQFEAIVLANGQSLDTCWSTLFPMSIAKVQLPVLNSFLRNDPILPWSIVRSTLVRMYSVNTARQQVLLTMKLMKMTMNKDESVAAYTDRFQKARREAGAPDNLMTYTLYIRSLPTDVAHQVRLAQTKLSAEDREKLQPHLPLRSIHNAFADASSAFDLRSGSLHDDDVTMNGTYTAPSS